MVFVGETHTRYDHHLNQLAIIEGLYNHNPNLAIGMEFFQQPFQPYIDDYIAGRIDEKAFLRDTEYYQRWRFDYRLYKPILDFAREKNIPVIALNVPQEITSKVGREGLESLTTEERKQIPQRMDSASEDYRQRLEAVYASHPHTGGSRFDNFLAVQLLWDEGMAERAARYLAQHPNRQLVVLAGSGHLEYGMGIPERLSRRRDVETVIVLQDLHGELEPERADFLLLPQEQRLPPAGMLGAALDSGERGVEVMSFSEDSAAQAAGIREGDLILALDGEPVKRFADVKLALWDKKPGELVTVRILRSRWLLGDQELDVDVGLR